METKTLGNVLLVTGHTYEQISVANKMIVGELKKRIPTLTRRSSRARAIRAQSVSRQSTTSSNGSVKAVKFRRFVRIGWG